VSAPATPASDASYRSAREGLAHRIREAAVVDVAGADRVAFLQGQLSQDVRRLAVGETRPTAALTPKGKLLFVARMVGLPDRVRLLLPPAARSAAVEHLKKFAVFQKVAITDTSEEHLRIGLYGPGARDLPVPDAAIALPGSDEFTAEWLVPVSARADAEQWLAANGSLPVDPATAEILRVEAGRPRFGQDIDGSNLPDEAGLDAATSATKGCYVGQEVVARRRAYGRTNRRLVGLRFPDGPVAPGTVLTRAASPEGGAGRAEAGRVTSAVVSPRFQAIGLGFAFHDVPVGGRLLSSQDPSRAAVVCAIPFE
jgi:folate-binding protein YgfZ